VSVRPFMIRLKRYIHPGVVISVLGHLAFLTLGLHLVGASSLNAVPADAMVVDIVTPSEAPRFSGAPSDLRSSGSKTQPKPSSPPVPAQATQPQSKPAAQSSQQQAAKPQRSAGPKTTPPQAARADLTQPDMEAKIQTAEQSPASTEPHEEETPEQTSTAETLARMALIGGQLGGGFNAPPVNTNQASYDYTAQFRERVSSCSMLPPGIEPRQKVHVGLRVFLNPDGTLGAPPMLLEPIASEEEKVLMQSAITALKKCQPYTMLPPKMYQRWKQLDLTFYPLNFFGG
jgi:hypothetical protein